MIEIPLSHFLYCRTRTFSFPSVEDESPEDPVPPGEIVKVRIDLWATGIRLFKGHRLRLQIASAAVPKFAAHTNTLEPPGAAVKAVIATNRIRHDEDRPSRVVLPVTEGWGAFAAPGR